MWARIILGALLVAMGAGKLSDVGGYARALAAFRALPDGALPAIAWVWLATELVAGALLFAGAKRRAPAIIGGALALVVNVAYVVMTTQAYARHLHVDNCTCFGVHLRQRLSWLVLAQDAYMIAFSAYVLVVAARRSRARARAESRSR